MFFLVALAEGLRDEVPCTLCLVVEELGERCRALRFHNSERSRVFRQRRRCLKNWTCNRRRTHRMGFQHRQWQCRVESRRAREYILRRRRRRFVDGEVFPLGQVVPVDLNRWCLSFGCLFFR